MIVNVNNVDINYEKYGSGKKSIIFLHGNGEDLSIFEEIADTLKEEYTVYLIDSRCHGKSEETKELHYNDMANDVADFIIKLEIDKPILFGFSDGGNVGLIIAGKYKDLLSQVIVAGANMNPHGMGRYYYIMKFISFFKKDVKLKLMVDEPNITKEFLERIEIPVIVLAGSKDLIVERQTREMASGIKGSTLKIINKEGHASYILDNKKLYETIKEYI